MITLYHGSDYVFNKFAFINVGKKSGTSGAGFGIYLTDNKADALAYGKYIYTVNAEFKKSLSNTKRTLTKNECVMILNDFELFMMGIEGNSYCAQFTEKPINYDLVKSIVNKNYNYWGCDTEFIGDIINTTNQPLELIEVLKKYGFTHAIDNSTPTDKVTTNYCVYDLSCLRIVKREKIVDDLTESIIELYQECIDSFNDKQLKKLFDCNQIPFSVNSPDLPSMPFPIASNIPQPLTGTKNNLNQSSDEISNDNISNNNVTNKDNESIFDNLHTLSDRMLRKERTLTLTQAQGRAKSKSQRRLMAMALAYKRGQLPKEYVSDTIKKLALSIKEETLHDFAKTNQKKRRKDGSVGKRNNIPDYVEDSKYAKESKYRNKDR